MGATVITDAIRILDQNGVPYGVKHAANKPRVSATPYLYDVVIGNIPGHTRIIVNGKNGDIDNATEDLWEPGGTYVYIPAGGIQLSLVSTSANDTAAGTGVRTVDVDVLLADYSAATITLTLNGVTPVLSTETNILRINDFHAMTVGSGGAPAGTVTLKNVAATITYAQLTPPYNAMRQAIYTVPLGKTLYIVAWKYGAGLAGVYANFLLRATTSNTDELLPVDLFHIREEGVVEGGSEYVVLPVPIKILATSDVKVSAISDGAASNAICTSGFAGWLE